MSDLSLEIQEQIIRSEKNIKDRINKLTVEGIDRSYLSTLNIYIYMKFIAYIYMNKDIKKIKQLAYFHTLNSMLLVKKLDRKSILSLGFANISMALLSDNSELINNYAELKNSTYVQDIKRGHLVSCVQAIIREDWGFLKNQIAINREQLGNKRGGQWIEADHAVFEGIMLGDKEKIEQALKLLVTKWHKKRNDDPIDSQIISMPALGYAKLAWLKGIEVEVDSPLIPKELLPIKPNEQYTKYDFMEKEEFKCDF
jgi:hypothetical protein